MGCDSLEGAGQEGIGLGSYGCRGREGWGVMVDLWLLGMNMWKRDGYYSMARGMVRRAAIGILLRGSKDKFVSTLKKRNEGIPNHEGSICERTDLLSRAKTLYGSNPERCGRFTLDIKEWLDKIAEIRSNPIWNTVIAGNKDIDMQMAVFSGHQGRDKRPERAA